MTLLHQPHDRLFKDSLKEKPVAVDFLQAHLPPEIFKRLDLNTLQLTDKSLLTPDLVEIHSDVVYRCQIDGKAGYIPILFLLERTPAQAWNKWGESPLASIAYSDA